MISYTKWIVALSYYCFIIVDHLGLATMQHFNFQSYLIDISICICTKWKYIIFAHNVNKIQNQRNFSFLICCAIQLIFPK